ncbi:IniB N-terminal domain-containing protein [Microbacterium sp. A196]|uniref:IniB N-terminal domain-containing protein n=1 Tax=Microbacterium sp. A196 TaxID=3457320 RepID=UPI003FD217D0
MISPVETIADALISFILSLLHDPDAAEEFTADPEAAMMRGGVQNACVADVRAVAPVVVDHPSVTPRPPHPGPPEPPSPPDPVVNEIVRLVSQFTTIDARSTIVDQSVNQNIWTDGGDVTQIFDQDAVVASGDESVAAGDDATLTDTDTDITTGDISIGNDEYNDSNNTDGSDNSTIDDSFQDNSQNDASVDVTVEDSFQDNSTDAGTQAQVAATPELYEPVVAHEEPADVLESDMAAAPAESYTEDASGVVVEDEPMIEEPVEQQ